jgi:hypothetical protein
LREKEDKSTRLPNHRVEKDANKWGQNKRGHVYGFLILPSSSPTTSPVTPSTALSPYCHQQGMIRKPMTVEELFINTDPEDGGDVDHV